MPYIIEKRRGDKSLFAAGRRQETAAQKKGIDSMDKVTTKKMDVPSIEGHEIVFIASVCVGDDGRAAIAFNALEGVNIVRVGQALAEFGADLAKRGTKAIEGPSEA